MTVFMDICISVGPVFLFLTVLVFLDSYKLIRFRSLVITVMVGAAAGVVCYFINSGLIATEIVSGSLYSKLIAPFVEEMAKGLYLFLLIKRQKIGFMVDAGIFGFAAGAGFAAVENIEYIVHLQQYDLLLWIMRGFGTAVMHGGTTCMLAIITKNLSDRSSRVGIHHLLPGFAVAVTVHSFFNFLIIDVRLFIVMQLILLPALIMLVFFRSEHILRYWLEVGLDTDVAMLEFITSGKVGDTKIGHYLKSMKEKFPGVILADMLCYLRINLELAIRAKGIILLKGAGFAAPQDPEITSKLNELKYLEKNIGRTGVLALAPLIHTHSRDLWQIYLVKKS